VGTTFARRTSVELNKPKKTGGFQPLASVGTGPSRGRPSRCFSKILAKMRLQRSVELNCSAAVRIPRKKQARVGEFFFDFVGLSVTEIEVKPILSTMLGLARHATQHRTAGDLWQETNCRI